MATKLPIADAADDPLDPLPKKATPSAPTNPALTPPFGGPQGDDPVGTPKQTDVPRGTLGVPASPAPIPLTMTPTPVQSAPPIAGPPTGAVPTPLANPAPMTPVANTPTTPIPLAPSGQLTNTGAPPVIDATNWQTGQAAIDARQAAQEADAVRAGQEDIANGYNINETQAELNARRGKVIDPATGAWVRPENVQGTPGDSIYNFTATPQGTTDTSQSINGGPLTLPNGAPLPIGTSEFGGTASAMDQPGATNLTPATTTSPIPLGAAAVNPIPLGGEGTLASGGDNTPQFGPAGSANNPAGVDRYKLAQDRLAEFSKSSDPYYQKSLRDARSMAAAGGQLGSGQLRTSLGDLAYNRDLQLNSAGNTFLQNALEGSIGDSYKNYGLTQQDQQTAFNQAVIQEQLNEALRQGDFSRYYQILNAGNANNPSGTALDLSQNYGNQASAAAQGAGQAAANGVGGVDYSGLMQWLQNLYGGGASTGDPSVYGDG